MVGSISYPHRRIFRISMPVISLIYHSKKRGLCMRKPYDPYCLCAKHECLQRFQGKSCMLYQAIMAGKSDLALEIANRCSGARVFGKLPIHFAAMRGQLPIVKALLDAGISPYVLDGEGNTLHFWAAQSGDLATFRHLVERENLTNVRNDGGWQPIHVAASRDRTEIVRYLIELSYVQYIELNSVIIVGESCYTPLALAELACAHQSAKLLRNSLREFALSAK